MLRKIISQRTICFPISHGEILLGMKLKGFGAGKYNGFGGKFDSAKGDKKIEDTAIRELEEESMIQAGVADLEHVAIIDFFFPEKPAYNQRVFVYLLKNWKGTPTITEEMDPKSFDINDVPYGKMWDSDKLWLPSLLEGKKFIARFIWKKDHETVEEFSIKFTDSFVT
jgi:8-oxo-dGTP diphosphatase